MDEERWYMKKLKSAERRGFQISIANRKEHKLTLRMAVRGILLIRKSVRIFSEQKDIYRFLMDFS